MRYRRGCTVIKKRNSRGDGTFPRPPYHQWENPVQEIKLQPSRQTMIGNSLKRLKYLDSTVNKRILYWNKLLQSISCSFCCHDTPPPPPPPLPLRALHACACALCIVQSPFLSPSNPSQISSWILAITRPSGCSSVQYAYIMHWYAINRNADPDLFLCRSRSDLDLDPALGGPKQGKF